MQVAISQRITKNTHGAIVDSLEHTYVTFFESYGITLLPIPNSLSPEKLYGYLSGLAIDGVILSGGGTTTSTDEVARNVTEEVMVSFASKNALPILGICRGAQRLNEIFGGSTVSDLQLNIDANFDHVNTTHPIHTVNMFTNVLPQNEFLVNSYHNDGIIPETLASNCVTVATAEDGTVEAFISNTIPALGVLWHPERKHTDSELNDILLEQFITSYKSLRLL